MIGRAHDAETHIVGTTPHSEYALHKTATACDIHAARPPRTRMTTRDDRQHIFGRSPPSDMRMPHFEKTQIAEKLNKVAEVFSKSPFCIILFGFFENTFGVKEVPCRHLSRAGITKKSDKEARGKPRASACFTDIVSGRSFRKTPPKRDVALTQRTSCRPMTWE